jgi:hypothetical protein
MIAMYFSNVVWNVTAVCSVSIAIFNLHVLLVACRSLFVSTVKFGPSNDIYVTSTILNLSVVLLIPYLRMRA